ncbi:MAG: NAD-dependent epimerase/dehydratase family protein [Actinomycetota bacterium]
MTMAPAPGTADTESNESATFDQVSPAEADIRHVVVTGGSWPLGRRVIERLGRTDTREQSSQQRQPTFVVRESIFDQAGDVVDHCDILVHLAPGDHDALAARGRSAVVGTPEILEQASRAGARHVLLLSSAMVYGAWPNNPIPLTEDATLRPDFGFAFARQLATVEQLVDDWRVRESGRQTCVLRPVPAMAADGTSSLVRALAAGMGGRRGVDDVPAQFVHLDDLADAVALCVRKGLSGIYNVAPEGFVPGSRVRALSGMSPRLRLPDRLGEFVDDLRWRFQRGPIPPGLRPYVRSPWLVSSGRLREAGWEPVVTNEQAFVEGTDAKWWTMLTPKRKQELALGATASAIVFGLLSVLWFLRRRR